MVLSQIPPDSHLHPVCSDFTTFLTSFVHRPFLEEWTAGTLTHPHLIPLLLAALSFHMARSGLNTHILLTFLPLCSTANLHVSRFPFLTASYSAQCWSPIYPSDSKPNHCPCGLTHVLHHQSTHCHAWITQPVIRICPGYLVHSTYQKYQTCLT